MSEGRTTWDVCWNLNGVEFKAKYFTDYHAEQFADAIRHQVDAVEVIRVEGIRERMERYSETFKKQLDYLKERGD